MPSASPEPQLARALRTVLAEAPIGADIADSPGISDALSALEWFVPVILSEVHSEWSGRALDGIVASKAIKTGVDELEVLGLCCFIQSQMWTPIQVHLQLADGTDTLSWLECRVGEREAQGTGMMQFSIPAGAMSKHLHRLTQRDIRWVYEVAFGH